MSCESKPALGVNQDRSDRFSWEPLQLVAVHKLELQDTMSTSLLQRLSQQLPISYHSENELSTQIMEKFERRNTHF